MITGEVSLPMPSSSITHHLLPRCLDARAARFQHYGSRLIAGYRPAVSAGRYGERRPAV